ncbi:hypothetical protein PanWU01x14_370820 [Parasponia andersonii]|uniref:Uncharacterized protein n=1 Tax=Parasponia andersonii TaxID=3476 RepID=A0A2P5A492_PARAD|nr:hypothetical protein PanWU01x14_370820 [Parasponia andersonii]
MAGHEARTLITMNWITKKCEKEEKSEKLKIKKAMKKGNIDGAQIYVENAIHKQTEQMNYLCLATRLDTIVTRLDNQANMTTIKKSMGSILSLSNLPCPLGVCRRYRRPWTSSRSNL